EPIDVPKHSSPFSTTAAEKIFQEALAVVKAEDVIPTGFGVAEAEWDSGIYPKMEEIKAGRKNVKVDLPFVVWWPRAVAWAQGLELM
ncbi:hypothetical protein B0H13DRAFT_1447161, partial [Mycena leptocephala]